MLLVLVSVITLLSELAGIFASRVSLAAFLKRRPSFLGLRRTASPASVAVVRATRSSLNWTVRWTLHCSDIARGSAAKTLATDSASIWGLQTPSALFSRCPVWRSKVKLSGAVEPYVTPMHAFSLQSFQNVSLLVHRGVVEEHRHLVLRLLIVSLVRVGTSDSCLSPSTLNDDSRRFKVRAFAYRVFLLAVNVGSSIQSNLSHTVLDL